MSALVDCTTVVRNLATGIGIFAIPYMAYVSLFKQMQERWLNRIKDAGNTLIEKCEKLYAAHGRYHDFDSYSKQGVINKDYDEEFRQKVLHELNGEIRNYKAEIIGQIFTLRHNFKNGDAHFDILKVQIEELRAAVDTILSGKGQIQTQAVTVLKEKETAFSSSFNTLLNIKWNKITDKWWKIEK